MTNEQAMQLVNEAVNAVAPTKLAELQKLGFETKIRDVGIDSVNAMEMVGVIEEKLGVTFPDEDLAQLNRFSDIVDLIIESAS